MASTGARRVTRLLKGVTFGGAAALGCSQALLLARQPCWRDATTLPSEKTKCQKHPEAPAAPHAKSVFVVGAGVAGMCCAYALQKRGYDVVVLDVSGGAGAVGSASCAAAGGMDATHKFSTPADWATMMRQLVPGLDPFKFFYISWLDVAGDLFFWRWLARFASESLFVRSQYIDDKRNSFQPVVEWGIEQTVRVMEEVPGLMKASHYQKAGSVLVSGGGGGYGKKVGSAGGTVPWDEARRYEPFLADACPSDEGTAVLNQSCRFGECASFTTHLADYCKGLHIASRPRW
eukprot:TRINITY_DN59048_c0_g1_i2.p1 TRINITY_DN59048_c0_g1~~TRINITY_DN59048_c0_g1_i2.p1  ORF type:complete len:315 (+),score=55.78 TRINITY_DN59048_c0_g1_i2:78-947(+)